MSAERVFTRPLQVFLAAVATVLGIGLVGQVWPPSLPAAVTELIDGDPDADERRALLQRVFELGVRSSDPAEQLLAAMAAVALDSESCFGQAAARLGGETWTGVAVGIAARPEMALGEPVLANLLSAIVAERQGDRALAAASYARVAAQGRLWRMALAGRLAAAGAVRIG